MPRVGAGSKLGWGEPVEARVRSVGVVVDPSCSDDLTRLVEVDGFQQYGEAHARQRNARVREFEDRHDKERDPRPTEMIARPGCTRPAF